MLYILLRYHPYVLLNSGIFLLITVITISLLRNIFRYYSKLLFQFTVTMLLGNITLLIVEWRPNDISDGFCTYLGNFSKKVSCSSHILNSEFLLLFFKDCKLALIIHAYLPHTCLYLKF